MARLFMIAGFVLSLFISPAAAVNVNPVAEMEAASDDGTSLLNTANKAGDTLSAGAQELPGVKNFSAGFEKASRAMSERIEYLEKTGMKLPGVEKLLKKVKWLNAAKAVAGKAAVKIVGELPNLFAMYGSYKGGDWIGVGQEGLDIALATLAAGGAVALTGATAPVWAALAAAGGVAAYSVTIKDGVDKAADHVAAFIRRGDDFRYRSRKLREWLAKAADLLTRAETMGRVVQVEITRLDAISPQKDIKESYQGTISALKQARESCRGAASWETILRKLEEFDRQVQALYEKIDRSRTLSGELCRLVDEMTPLSHPEILKMWAQKGSALNTRAGEQEQSVHDLFDQIAVSSSQIKEMMETARTARGEAEDALLTMNFDLEIIEAQLKGFSELDASSLSDQINMAIAFKKQADHLIQISKKIVLMKDSEQNLIFFQRREQEYRIPEKLSAVAFLETLQGNAQQGIQKMADRIKTLTSLKAWINSNKDFLTACSGFQLDDSRVEQSRNRLAEARLAMKNWRQVSGERERCALEAKTLADKSMREREPPDQTPLAELARQAQQEIESCHLEEAAELIKRIRALKGYDANAVAENLAVELGEKIRRRQPFLDQIQIIISALNNPKSTKTGLDAAGKELYDAGLATGCSDDKKELKKLLSQASEAFDEKKLADQEDMKQKVYAGQRAQNEHARKMREIAGEMLATWTTLQQQVNRTGEILSPATSDSLATDTSSPSVRPRSETGKSSGCMVQAGTFSMRPEKGRVYYINYSSAGIGTGYAIVSFSEQSVRDGIPGSQNLLGPYRNLSDAQNEVRRRCPDGGSSIQY